MTNMIQAQNIEPGDIIETKDSKLHTIEKAVEMPMTGRYRLYTTEGAVIIARYGESFFIHAPVDLTTEMGFHAG